MDDGVELKQLTVGVDSVGLGVGAGLASAIVLMAISAASVVIVFIIYCLSIVGGRLVMIAGQPLWQSKRNLLWGLGGYFSPSSPRTAAGSSRKKLVLPLLAGLLKARLKPSSYFRELRSAVSVERGEKWKHQPDWQCASRPTARTESVPTSFTAVLVNGQCLVNNPAWS
jgi:hypothetical protein